ncbi:hypothetical protein TEA_021052 [Camellia sinensis var. sinensis]|uniref:Uncharacterized protein n=1 Tax=Camellia sinensis var. sinensis TaxID=542762 RepID=A0A4S4E6Z7_CAMSN|nr:hypothetical protein TEA_021052 [Camellia sinensis var. sinensis]
MPCALCHSRNAGPFSFPRANPNLFWPFIVFLLVGLTLAQKGMPDSHSPTHTNFFRRGRQRILRCGDDPAMCSDRERNPWGGDTCCFQKFCKDITSDSNHCGGCGHACGFGLVCCDGKCVDVQSDSMHCGACFEECPGENRCSYAMCDYGG